MIERDGYGYGIGDGVVLNDGDGYGDGFGLANGNDYGDGYHDRCAHHNGDGDGYGYGYGPWPMFDVTDFNVANLNVANLNVANGDGICHPEDDDSIVVILKD